jgi:AcrR family transcriptional regulator
MPRRRTDIADDSAARIALLDATERLMVEEGYAAVTSRRVSAEAGVNNGLVHYYFGTMDDLFVQVFRRRSERSLERLRQALDEPQPLWALWELTHETSNNAITMEFIALANHRKAIREEIAAYSRAHRRLQIERLDEVLDGYGVDRARWPATAVLLLMAGTARFLLMEESFDVVIGHDDAVAAVEREIAALEGPRRRPTGRP